MELLRLPGIGPYTAAAILAFAFGYPSAPVDGNVVRVISRLMNEHTPLPALQTKISKLFSPIVPKDSPGDLLNKQIAMLVISAKTESAGTSRLILRS